MTEAQWLAYARKHLVGRTITSVAYITRSEAKENMWHSRPVALMLDNGSMLWPQSDDEGNNGGALAGIDKDGNPLAFPVLR